MERDPLRYVWSQSRLTHVAALGGALVLAPLMALAFDLPRLLIDNALIGKAFSGPHATAPLLALKFDLPLLFDESLVLSDGLPLGREAYLWTGAAVLAAVALVRSAIIGGLGLVRGRLARRLAGRLRLTLFRRMVASRLSARDEAMMVADLAGRGVTSVGRFLGDALIVPALAATEVLVVVAFAAAINAWLGLAMLGLVLLHGLAIPLAVQVAHQRDAAHAAREAEIGRAAQDASRRLAAIRIHGTAWAEEAAFAATLGQFDAIWRGFGRRLTGANALMGLFREMAPAAIIGIGGMLALLGQVSTGGVVAVLLASLTLPRPIAALVEWGRQRRSAMVLFEEMARTVGALQSRTRRGEAHGKLVTGESRLEAKGLAALDPISGLRISGINVGLDLPAHVGLVGDSRSGAEVFAGLIGGAVEPSAGALTLAGIPVTALDAASRAARIAYAGGAPSILDATLRDNILYGSRPDAQVTEAELVAALTVAGLDGEVYALGLSGTLAAANDPAVAEAVVAARRAVRRALSAEASDDLVDPFDPARYNRHATLAENLMFGVPVGDTFHEANLARHPFMRAVLEAESLTVPLANMGLSIAGSMVEIFEGVPEGHPLFERFSFFRAGERGTYEDLVARQSERRRGGEAMRDRDRLVALALRYVETRHRLGLIEEDLERRIVAARRTFRSLLPQSLGPAVEFYDPDRLCAAASLADNILFGRVAHDVAGAEEHVRRIVRRVLAERALDQAVFGVGLNARVSRREQGTLAGRAEAIDLARCLVRRPDILVVAHATDGLGGAQARTLVTRLRTAMAGRSLFVVLPDGDHATAFDVVLQFERGGVAIASGPRVAPRLAMAQSI